MLGILSVMHVHTTLFFLLHMIVGADMSYFLMNYEIIHICCHGMQRNKSHEYMKYSSTR